MTTQRLKTLKNGKRGRDEDGIARLGLSPRPITTGRSPIAVTDFLRKTEDGLVELRMTVSNPWPLQMQVIILAIAIIFAAGFWVMTWQDLQLREYWGDYPWSDWFFNFFVSAVIFAVCHGILKDIHDLNTSTPPIRFHAQRQAVLFSWAKSNIPKPERPFMETIGTDKNIVMTLVVATTIPLAIMLTLGILQEGSLPKDWLFVPFLYLVGTYPAYKILPPWFKYFINSWRYKQTIETMSIPWESVQIESHTFSGVGYVGAVSTAMLTLYAPIPDGIGDSTMIGIGVASEHESVCLYELLRDYMENGAEGIEHTAADKVKICHGEYTREGYRNTIEAFKHDHIVYYPFWRLFNLLTLRYFIHCYMEYTFDTLLPKLLDREDVKEWSKPIPKEEWVKQSEELTEINKKIRELYAKGYSWESAEVQGVIFNEREGQAQE